MKNLLLILALVFISCLSRDEHVLNTSKETISNLKDFNVDATNYDFIYSKILECEVNKVNIRQANIDSLYRSLQFYEGSGAPSLYVSEKGNTIFFESRNENEIDVFFSSKTKESEDVLSFIKKSVQKK